MTSSRSERRAMVQSTVGLSKSRQCSLLEIHRSGLYYKPCGESVENLTLMRLIDEEYLRHPWVGVRRMTVYLRGLGYPVNRKRVARLYRQMGLAAIYPKPRTSVPGEGHTVYPYLLRDLKIDRPNQVWAIDITYIPMERGYMYLVAIIDLWSRYVVNWSLSNSMDAAWCADVLAEAVARHGKPEILNSDQGSQFTSTQFQTEVAKHRITMSMDGKGRAIDNVFIERLWRSVKYEYVYLAPTRKVDELYEGLREYFTYYNQSRHHQALDYRTPQVMYRQAA